MKRILGIAAGLFIGWTVLQWLLANPKQAASTVNDGAHGVSNASGSLITFFSALGGGAILVLVILGIAVYLAKRK
jgi:hypothetical protein